MYKLSISSVVFLFFFNNLFSQNKVVVDTLKSNMHVTFNKVQPSVTGFSTATLNMDYIPASDMIVMRFEVPCFFYRSNTTLSDFCIIHTDENKYKFFNQIKKIKSVKTLNYNFTFVIPKVTLQKIMQESLKKIIFNFSPNYDNIKLFYDSEKFMGASFKKYLINLGKHNLKYKVSQPDLVQYNLLISWLEKQ